MRYCLWPWQGFTSSPALACQAAEASFDQTFVALCCCWVYSSTGALPLWNCAVLSGCEAQLSESLPTSKVHKGSPNVFERMLLQHRTVSHSAHISGKATRGKRQPARAAPGSTTSSNTVYDLIKPITAGGQVRAHGVKTLPPSNSYRILLLA